MYDFVVQLAARNFTTIRIAEILDSLCDVVDQARASGNLSSAWARALDSAYGWLLEQDEVEFDHLCHALRVESASELGR